MSTDILKKAERIREVARLNFEKDGGIAAMLFAFQLAPGEEIAIVPLDMDHKNLVQAQLKVAGSLSDGVVLLCEVWMLTGDRQIMNKQDLYDGYGSVDNHPLRQEAVVMTVETRKEGKEAWKALIYRPEGKKPILEEWEKLPLTAAEGRFINVVPDERTPD